MADFVQNSETKNAVRELTNPIPDVATFNTIVQSVITGNPFGCVAYMTAGVTHDPVEKIRENYTARIVYQDVNAKTVGNDSSKFNSIAGFNAGAAALLASAALATAHGGTAVRDTESESFSTTLRCHDPNGELYNLTFSRGRVTLQSYSDDAIRTKVETWADTVAALA
jgi:hypothetical protein